MKARTEEDSPSFLARARPLIVARAIAAGISFGIPLVLARALSQNEYGIYKQLILVSQTLFYVLPLGMPQSLYYFLPRAAERQRTYQVQAFLALVIMGAAAAAALVLGAGRIGGWVNSPDFSRYAPALAVYLFGLMCSSILETSLTARGQTTLASACYLGSEVLKLAAMTLPILLGLGLVGLVYGMAALALARLVATVVLLRGAEGPLVSKEALAAQLRWALPFGAAIAIAVPQQSFHQYAVSAHFDSAAFAIYSVGLFNLPVVDLLYTPTSEVLMVALGELERKGRLREGALLFRSAVSRLAYTFIPLTVFLVMAAPSLITALFTERYLASVPIFRVAVCITLLGIFPIDGVLRARGQTGHIFRINVIKAVITVPGVLFAIAHFGLMGGVCAWLFCEVLGKSYLLSRVPRALGEDLRRLLPWSELARAMAAALAAIAGALAAGALAGPSMRPLFLLACTAAGYGAAYLAVLPLLGIRVPDAVPWLRRQPAKA